MKRLAFFFALLVGLNATAVVRKPEEEENQAVVVNVDNKGDKKSYSSLIQRITNNLKIYFYAITKEGRADIISWERISQIFNPNDIIDESETNKNTDNQNNIIVLNKVNWIQISYNSDGNIEFCELEILPGKK